jgi:tRNA-splicing ligase RtcB
MNTSQLRKLGVPDECLRDVIMAIQSAAAAGGFKGSEVKRLIRSILEKTEDHADHPHFGSFARALVEERNFTPPPPVEYRTWGTEILECDWDSTAHLRVIDSLDARRPASH